MIFHFNDLFIGSLGEDFEPEFVGDVHNVTVVVGREAVLSCSVMKLNDFKVGWIKVRTVFIVKHQFH